MRKEIDGSKNDIRVLCSGAADSSDAGLVEGVPIDPPDERPGWVLVDLWVEHDSLQENEKSETKGEKAKVVTRLVNPAYYQLWIRPKSAQKKKRGRKKKELPDSAKTDFGVFKNQHELAATAIAKADEPKKKRGRKKKAAPNGSDEPGLTDSDETEKELSGYCVHTRQMLIATVNGGDERPIALADLRKYSPLCHDCQKVSDVEAT